MNLTHQDKINLVRAYHLDEELPEETWLKLYEHYCNNGEMPYGTAKARTGDPYNWIADRMDAILNDYVEPEYDQYIAGDITTS